MLYIERVHPFVQLKMLCSPHWEQLRDLSPVWQRLLALTCRGMRCDEMRCYISNGFIPSFLGPQALTQTFGIGCAGSPATNRSYIALRPPSARQHGRRLLPLVPLCAGPRFLCQCAPPGAHGRWGPLMPREALVPAGDPLSRDTAPPMPLSPGGGGHQCAGTGACSELDDAPRRFIVQVALPSRVAGHGRSLVLPLLHVALDNARQKGSR